MAAHKIIISGFGGQGVMLIGQMIAKAGMLEGKEITWMPSYGPEMRGGTANCAVIVSDRRISSPVVSEATAVVAMNLPSMLKFEKNVIPGGKLFINSSLINDEPSRKDIRIYKIDANKIADQNLNNAKVSNMVILGAVINETNVVSMESVERVMDDLFTGKKSQLVPLNKQALAAWRNSLE